MRKDGNKKYFATKKNTRSWSRYILIGITTLILCTGVFLTYHFKKQPAMADIASYFVRIKTWIAERKNSLHQGIKQVKQLANNKEDEEQEVHFEFYNTLPNMQVKVTPTVNDSNKKEVASTQKKLIKPEEVEQELSAQIKHNKAKH